MPQLPPQWPTTPKGLPNGRVLPTVATRGLWGATGHQKRRQAAWNPGNRAPWRRRSRGETERRLVPFRREWELRLLLCCVGLATIAGLGSSAYDLDPVLELRNSQDQNCVTV